MYNIDRGTEKYKKTNQTYRQKKEKLYQKPQKENAIKQYVLPPGIKIVLMGGLLVSMAGKKKTQGQQEGHIKKALFEEKKKNKTVKKKKKNGPQADILLKKWQ